MKRKEMRIAAVALAGIVVVSGGSFSTQAMRVNSILPVAGVGLTLEEGTSVENLEQIAQGNTVADSGRSATVTPTVAVTPTVTPTVTPKAQDETEEAETDEAAVTDEELSEDVAEDEETGDEYDNLVIAQVHDWVNVRRGPSTDSEIIGKLYNNSVGELIRVEGD